jgi:hypothetical protein
MSSEVLEYSEKIDDLIRIFRGLRKKLEHEKHLLLGDTMKKLKVANEWLRYAELHTKQSQKDLDVFKMVWPDRQIMTDCL